MSEVASVDSSWQPVKIGAGGWLTGIDIAKDGTKVVRTDTYGAYIWNGAAWQQLVTVSSMPAGTSLAGGIYEIRIAPSNSNILYMAAGSSVYKSTDKGQSWIKTGLSISTLDPNSNNRMDGQKLAIDPSNPNIVFAGTQKDGLWVTRDGGNTWEKVIAVPQGTNTTDPGLTGILIQGSVVYVGTAGSGVYRSNDGGKNWESIGGPSDISHAAIAPDGTYYASGNTQTALWKYANGTWTKLVDTNAHAIAIDPFNSAHLVVADGGGNLRESKDGGATWGEGWNWGKQLESSNDIPWLEKSGGYMSTGGLVFDPAVPGKVWQSAGVGVWHTQMPANMQWNTPVVWHSQSSGIEQLVANDIIAPVGGNPVFSSWDRAFFEVSDPNTYASAYGGGDFSMGWSVDYASSTPSFIVGISDYWGKEESGYSTDGGNTWQKFAGLPSFAMDSIGGSIAASSASNFIWAPAGGHAPAYTLNGGVTWNSISLPGKSDWSEFHPAYYLSRTTVTADRVQPNTFYLYDQSTGVYRSNDGGVTWTQMFKGPVSDWSYWNAKIEAVPGKAGELYFTAGPLDGDPSTPASVPFMHSTDGGATWQSVPNVLEVHTFGYGAPANTGGPSTVYIVGYVGGDYGIWYSADAAQSWTKIGENPMGSFDNIKTVSGDMNHFGKVYVGFGGSGYAYLNFSGSQLPAPTAPAPTHPAQANVTSISGTAGKDALVGTPGADRISGVPDDGTKLGKNTVDKLVGQGGADTFVLGDARGAFYDDGLSKSPGVRDYAWIADFGPDDLLQLHGSALDYVQGSTTFVGVTGMGIYLDSNGNKLLDGRDELIALLQDHGPINLSDQLFIAGQGSKAAGSTHSGTGAQVVAVELLDPSQQIPSGANLADFWLA